METTNNKMTVAETAFFDKLGAYLETPLYFYGSIQRPDYVPRSSDIDVDIFSFHEKSMVVKLSTFLNVDPTKFKRFVTRANHSPAVINGYKYMYKSPDGKISVEFSLYNEKHKELILKEHRRKMILPLYVLYPLIILKFIYYRLQMLPTNVFIMCKRFLMNFADDVYDGFVVLD